MEGVYVVGAGPGDLGDRSPPVGSRGKAPIVRPLNLKQNVKLIYNF